MSAGGALHGDELGVDGLRVGGELLGDPGEAGSRLRVLGGLPAEALRKGEELAEAASTHVVLLQQRLRVHGGGPTRSGLEAAAVHEPNHREHLGAGAQLEDAEQVGFVVPKTDAMHQPATVVGAPDTRLALSCGASYDELSQR